MNLQSANQGAPPNTGFLVKQVSVNGDTRNYGVFIPHDYSPAQKYPVIVFLHGIMEAGSNGTSNMGVGLGPSIAKHPADFKFIVVFPQSPGKWNSDDRAAIAIACLDQVQRDYSTDPSRVILTGLSTGGEGTWAVGARYPDRFSALVPMCGFADYADVPKLTGVPIWCFHNSGDWLVPAGGSEEMCNRINAAGGNAKFTKYSDFGHNCWDQAYDQGELFAWMLEQHRGAPAMAQGHPPAAATPKTVTFK
jgi:predicted peptidase